MTRQELKNELLKNKHASRKKDIRKELLKYHKDINSALIVIRNNLPPFHEFKCEVCNKLFSQKTSKYIKTCSKECRYKKSKLTVLERYGVDNISKSDEIKEKKKQTLLKNFGVEHPSQSEKVKEKVKQNSLEKYGVEHHLMSKEVIEKRDRTNLEKYGYKVAYKSPEVRERAKERHLEKYDVEHNFQREDVKEKIKETMLDRYGVEYASQSEEIKDKIRETMLDRYGVEHFSQTEKYKEKIRETSLERYGSEHYLSSDIRIRKMKEYLESDEYFMKHLGFVDPTPYLNGDTTHSIGKNNGFSHYIFRRLLKVKGINYDEPATGSSYEDAASIFLDELGIYHVRGSRQAIKPYELDIFIPDYNIAIEMNGVYWHSPDRAGSNDKNYHQMKFNICKEYGITLIQITDIEWNNDSDKWKNLIRSKLGMSDRIYARKTKVITLTDLQARNFTDLYHIQGHRTAKHYLGLEYNGDIVALMSFMKHREYDWELIRFCSKENVLGGFSKLLSYFRKHNPGSIFSYSNSNFSIGDVYVKNGFEYLGQTTPSYYWTDSSDVKSRYEVQKYKLGYPETEVEYMTGLGYYRYFDAGNERWILR